MKIGSIVIRCYEFDQMLAFWQEALHYVPREPAKSGWVVFCDPEGTGPNLSLDRCPERGCVANTAIQTGQSDFVLFETLYLWAFQRCRTQPEQLKNRICNTSADSNVDQSPHKFLRTTLQFAGRTTASLVPRPKLTMTGVFCGRTTSLPRAMKFE